MKIHNLINQTQNQKNKLKLSNQKNYKIKILYKKLINKIKIKIKKQKTTSLIN